MSRKLLSIVSLALAAINVLPTLAAETPKGTGEVVITSGGGTWEAAQKKAYFEPFERDTGIKVVLVPEDHAKLLASVEHGQPEADITSINAGQLTGFTRRNAVEKIDYSSFDQATLNGMPAMLKNEYGVGAVLYSVMMAYNTTEFPAGKPRPENWADFFDIAKFPGPRGMARCEKMIDGGLIEFAALAAGADRAKLYPLDLDKAFAQIEKIKPDVARWWQAGAEAPQSLVDGDVVLSSAYNGRVYVAMKQGAPLAMNWQDSLIQYDYWVVMKNSPNRENAMKFLAYVSRAEPQAVFAKEMTYGPVNNAAYKMIDNELAALLPGSPQNVGRQIYQDYGWWNTVSGDGKSNWDRALERCLHTLSQ